MALVFFQVSADEEGDDDDTEDVRGGTRAAGAGLPGDRRGDMPQLPHGGRRGQPAPQPQVHPRQGHRQGHIIPGKSVSVHLFKTEITLKSSTLA